MKYQAPLAAALTVTLLGLTSAATPADDWVKGDPALEAIGALTIGPDGVLFAADPQGATVYALKFASKPAPIEAAAKARLALEDVDAALAASVGTERENVRIHDLAVAEDGSAYLSFTRTGKDSSTPLLARLAPGAPLAVLDWKDASYQKLVLDNAPAQDEGRRSKRTQSITDLEFHQGLLYVAGLSNEEFASKLRAVSYPFDGAGKGRSIEIYHAAHGAWETRAPVRTMVPIHVGGDPYLLCGYTCTPLVKVPISQVAEASAEKFVGTTVAELGNRNTPLDMLVYEKGDARFVLIANTSRGVMKVSTAGLEEAEGLTERVERGGTGGLGYETIDALKDVTQLAGLDDKHAVILVEKDGKSSLRTIELP